MISENQFNLLFQKIDQLQQIIQDQGTLGLTHGRRFIYIEKTKKSVWAFVDTDEPVDAIALTGYITEIYRKEGDHPKLHIVMRTREEEFVLCSGFETHFSRDVMAAIAQLTPELAKRPIKIVPTVKESPAKSGAERKGHQPVYANCISATGSTIRTFQMKRDYSAAQLFEKAIVVLSSKSEFQGFQRVHVSATPCTESRDYVRETQPVQAVSTPKTESVDWKAFCQQYGVLPGALKALATELGLPQGKLNPSQSATLYQAAYGRWGRITLGHENANCTKHHS